MDVHKLLEDIYKVLKKVFPTEEVKIEKSKNNKFPNFLIICLSVILAGMLVILVSDFFKSTSTVKLNSQEKAVLPENVSFNTQDYEAAAENKLKTVLEDMDGVGKVKVMITFDGSEEQIPAINVNDSTNTTKEKDPAGGTRDTTQKNNGSTIVITNDGIKNQPLIIKTAKPKVVGVCVIAEGAKDRVIELKITQAVTRLYNIPADKVSVFPMKK